MDCLWGRLTAARWYGVMTGAVLNVIGSLWVVIVEGAELRSNMIGGGVATSRRAIQVMNRRRSGLNLRS